jgi:hypothetical protein
MSGCLYYPNWDLRDSIFWGNLLVFWDRVTFIVPENHRGFDPYNEDKDVLKSLKSAHEIYGVGHPPNRDEKNTCHAMLKELFIDRKDLVEKYRKIIGEKPYVIAYNKVNPETVDMLKDAGLFEGDLGDVFYTKAACGYLVMAVLAHCCSSKRLPPLTDEPDLFRINVGSVIDSLEAIASKENTEPSDETSPLLLLKRIPFLASSDDNPKFLSKVLVARKKDDVNGYRKVFHDNVMRYIEKLESSEVSAETYDILRDFDGEIKNDMKNLKRELIKAGVNAITSKEGIAAILAGLALGTISPEMGTTLGLTGGLKTYRKARSKAFKNHWTSWLYNVQNPRFSIF